MWRLIADRRNCIWPKTRIHLPSLLFSPDCWTHLSISEVSVWNVRTRTRVWSDSFSFISNIHAMGDFTFKQRASDDFSTFPKCGMFQLHQDAEYLIVIINRRVRLRNCWLFISKEVSLRYPGILMIHHQKRLDTKVLQITNLSLHQVIQSSSDSECSQECHDLSTHQEKKKVINIKSVPPSRV